MNFNSNTQVVLSPIDEELHGKPEFSIGSTPAIVLGEDGNVFVMVDVNEAVLCDNVAFTDFQVAIQSGRQELASLHVFSPVSELLDSDLEAMSEDSVDGKFPIAVKPKYDKIREELQGLIAKIDDIEYQSE